MSDDFEQQARAAGRRVKDEAAELARHGPDRRQTSVKSHRTRWLAVAAALLVVAGTASLVVVASSRDAHAPTDTAPSADTGPLPDSTTVPDTAASTPAPASSTIPAPQPSSSATPTTSVAQPVGVAAPDLPLVAFQEDTCQVQTIRWDDPDGPFVWNAFARGIADGAPAQVIADPSAGAAGPFAVVLRDYEPSRPAGTGSGTEINGNQVYITTYDALDGSGQIGNGEAVWNLPDGSQGYLRARGLDRDDIASIVTNLHPRPPDDPNPGFDYDTANTQPDRLTHVAEQTTDTLSSSGYSITCLAHHGADVPVAVIADQGVAPYAVAIDRHRPAWITRADGAVFIGGIEARNAHGSPDPPADTLTTISPQQWRQLWSPNPTTIAPEFTPSATEAIRIGAIGQPPEDTTTLALTRSNGRIHLDLTNTVLDPTAVSIEIHLNGEPVHTQPLPTNAIDVASRSDQGTTLDLRVLDDAGNTIQQSGHLYLTPTEPT